MANKINLKGFQKRKSEYHLISKVKWIYDLNIPQLNYHLSKCVEQKMSYASTLLCLFGILERENTLLRRLLEEKMAETLSIDVETLERMISFLSSENKTIEKTIIDKNRRLLLADQGIAA